MDEIYAWNKQDLDIHVYCGIDNIDFEVVFEEVRSSPPAKGGRERERSERVVVLW